MLLRQYLLDHPHEDHLVHNDAGEVELFHAVGTVNALTEEEIVALVAHELGKLLLIVYDYNNCLS